ncbi:MAG: hypothetical protein OEV63_03905 [Gammaproteobacteria bacterium]|nr:hypothetical protein [Gammaproteobacteria bacterium]MDH5213130.1 hypothetical protein [Gammaproteobacteria bacterium]MDH5499606.1 hypothetical protein [Gammaproteobacteria bacterium]
MLTFLNTALSAQGVDSMGSDRIGDRPNAAGGPTIVSVGLYVIDIDAIDDAEQRFSADLFVNIGWQDPRLALPEGQRSGKNRTLPLSDIWSPRGLIVNDRGMSTQLPRVADVDDLGNVQYRQRLTGDLAVDLDLREFPFDTQRLPIDIISYQYSPDSLRLVSNAAIARSDGLFSAEGWHFRMLEPETGDFTIPAAGVVRPQLNYVMEARRKVPYYLVTIFLPISLIIFMSWMAFWLRPDIVPVRIGISTTSIFSIIAFGFSIRLSLPPVSYMTRADMFVVGCMVMVFLAFGVAVIGSRWASSDRLEQALRLNVIARWVYVGMFGVIAAAALVF